MRYYITTLGCKVNQYESQFIAERLDDAGYLKTKDNEPADVCIINTCAVTAEAERKARQFIRRVISSNPDSYVIVTGCYAQLTPEEIIKIHGVSLVIGNSLTSLCAEIAVNYLKTGEKRRGIIVKKPSDFEFEKMSVAGSERTRAYIKIEDGCNSKCAYCAIKNARGPIRSKPLSDIVSEAENLVRSGYKEIVLTGIEISGWGKDTAEGDLADVVVSLSKIRGLERVRLGSLDPAVINPSFADSLSLSDNLCHHFHLSLQSGCDKTLFAMKRRYSTSTVTRNVCHLRELFDDATFTADTIVGFPGEESAAYIEGLGLLYNHIFPFSARPDTEAYYMDGQVDDNTKSKRVHAMERIRGVSSERIKRQYIGKVTSVIFEERKNGYSIGHTPNYIEVFCKSDKDLRGKTVNVTISEIKDGKAFGVITDESLTED